MDGVYLWKIVINASNYRLIKKKQKQKFLVYVIGLFVIFDRVFYITHVVSLILICTEIWSLYLNILFKYRRAWRIPFKIYAGTYRGYAVT